MDNFEILKNIIEGKVNINDIDSETKGKLIKMCEDRLNEVERKIKEKNKQIEVMLKIINK